MQRQRAVVLERAEEIPGGAVHGGHDAFLGQALGDLVGDVIRGGHALDSSLLLAIRQHHLDRLVRGLSSLDLLQLALMVLLEQRDALLVIGLLLGDNALPGGRLDSELSHRGSYGSLCSSHARVPLQQEQWREREKRESGLGVHTAAR